MNANTQAALSWLQFGVSPIPILPHSKTPAILWRTWQTRLPTKKIVSYWFEDTEKNIGIICGGKPNLAILDFDDIHSYYDWRKDMIKRDDVWKRVATKTYRVRTARGMHLYVKTEVPEKSRKYPDTKIDVRCSGNYTLVPPSIHPSGALYDPIGTQSDIMTVNNIKDVFPDIEVPHKEFDTPCREFDIFDSFARDNTIRDIKSNIRILQFVSQYSRVTRGSANGRWWWARCIDPMHKDVHPSMRIDTFKNRIACMSPACRLYHNIGFDVIDVYCIINNVGVKEAINELGNTYL
jgi:hypothetical protein